MPFLTFTVALIAVAARADTVAWICLAISTGFLVNGHVSFVGVCGIPVVLIAIYALVKHRASTYRGPVLASLIFALFLVPLIIREIHHAPGAIEEYISFAKQIRHTRFWGR